MTTTGSVGIERLPVHCCIAGGGPAGMMLGLLLARAGIGVLVMEKHAEFLRDFPGDTIHPSTLAVTRELGMLAEVLELPHRKAPQLGAQVGDLSLVFADFSYLPTNANTSPSCRSGVLISWRKTPRHTRPSS